MMGVCRRCNLPSATPPADQRSVFNSVTITANTVTSGVSWEIHFMTIFCCTNCSNVLTIWRGTNDFLTFLLLVGAY